MSGVPSARRLISVAWSRPAAAGAHGPRTRDIVLVGVLGFLTVLEGALRTDLVWPFPTVLTTLVLLPGLLWRRTLRLPVIVFTTIVSTGFEVAQQVSDAGPDALVTMLALIMLPYALFRWGSGRDRIVGGAVLAGSLPLSVLLGGEGVAGAVAGVSFVGGACLIGTIRRDRVKARTRELDHARLREREALARDLHDTVAHHLSAIAIRVQAAAAIPHDAHRVAESLDVIESQAQAALTEMRSLVRALRRPADYAPSHGLDDLAGLANPGPPRVTVRIDAPKDLPHMVAATLFRIGQESVTNARKHARHATAVEVRVTAGPGEVGIRVHDDGAAARSMSREGHGLRGLTERAALLRGEFAAGPAAEGGWTVSATLPLEVRT